MTGSQREDASDLEGFREGEGAESIDVAVADALKAQKNRQTGGFPSQSMSNQS